MSSGSRRNKSHKDHNASRKNPKANEHAAGNGAETLRVSPEKVPDPNQRAAVESLLRGRSTSEEAILKRPGNPEDGIGGNPEVKVTGDTPLVDPRPDTFNESARHDMDKYGGRKRN